MSSPLVELNYGITKKLQPIFYCRGWRPRGKIRHIANFTCTSLVMPTAVIIIMLSLVYYYCTVAVQFNDHMITQ